MTQQKQFRAIKGTRDILPPDSALWNWFERSAREVFESYNFREIRLPIFEETALVRAFRGHRDGYRSKEMFTFRFRIDRIARQFDMPAVAVWRTSLRPEATASTMRAYIEHGMQALPGNVKLYCVGPDVPA